MVTNKFLNSLINYEKLVKYDYNFKLVNFKHFLKSIGSPEQNLKNVILIAGTKGKGSTATFIESCLRACGLKTALFTSPHLVSIQERIKVNNKPISQQDIDRLVNKIKPQVEKYKITFFEAMTAIAFLYFLEKQVDYTILEVGLGGRLDATNVVNPQVAVITRIGFDHLNLLGRTLEKIAQEKAGIIHPQSFVVISKQKSSALKSIINKIKENKNQYYYIPEKITIKEMKSNLEGCKFTFLEQNQIAKTYQIRVIGKHQIENALTAWAVLNYLKKHEVCITEQGIKKGLAKAHPLGRCQIITQQPLIIIDSAHNPESAQSLYYIIHDIIKQKVIIVYGSSEGKLVSRILDILSPLTKRLILTQSQNPRRIPIEKLAKMCRQKSLSYQISDTVKDAIKLAKHLSKNKIPIIITGSFYIAGEALTYFKNKAS